MVMAATNTLAFGAKSISSFKFLLKCPLVLIRNPALATDTVVIIVVVLVVAIRRHGTHMPVFWQNFFQPLHAGAWMATLKSALVQAETTQSRDSGRKKTRSV